MTEILVTGGAGFIGSHITNYLIKHGHDVAVVDNLEIGKREYVNKYADFYKLDLRDRANLDFVIKRIKPEITYHCQAHAAEGQSVFTPIYTVDSNLIGFLNLFTSLLNVGFKTIVFTSSMAVYGKQSFGDLSFKGGFLEDQPRQPVDPYGITKADIERLLEIYSKEYGFNYVTFRPHNVFGENQSLTNPYRNVFGIWMNRIMNSLSPVIYGDGTQTRAFTYIDDCTKIMAESAWNPKAYGEIFNIGSDEVHTVNEACKMLMEAMGVPFGAIHAPERPMEVKHAWCLPPNQIVMTNELPKRIQDVQEGDLILQSNGKYEPVEKVYMRNHHGVLIKVKAKLLSFYTTEDHPILVIPKEIKKLKHHKKRVVFDEEVCLKDWLTWKKASELKVEDYLVIPKITTQEDIIIDLRPYIKKRGLNQWRLPKKTLQPTKCNEALATLFGWYLAEGHCSGHTVCLSLSLKEEKEAQLIASILKNQLGYNPRLRKRRTTYSIEVDSCVFGRFLTKNFGKCSLEKKLPSWLFKAKNVIVTAFLRAYIQGDGCLTPKDGVWITTASITLAHQLPLLLSKIGVIPSVSKRKGGTTVIEGRTVSVHKSYSILISNSQLCKLKFDIPSKNNWVLHDSEFFYIPVTKLSKKQYVGSVYNLKTKNETFGLPFIVHNCSQEKAKRVLGYNPRTSLKDGLKKMAKWAKKQGAQPFNYMQWKKVDDWEIKRNVPSIWKNKKI